MKLVFSITLLIVSLKSFAVTPILISYKSNEKKANQVQKIISKEIGIPKKLIMVRHQPDPCVKDFDRILHICIDHKNELQMIHQNKDVLVKSFQVFLK